MPDAPMCVADWLDEHLSDDLLRAGLAGRAIAHTWLGPRSAGSAALLLARESRAQPPVVGGAPALVEALTAACAAAGTTVITGRRTSGASWIGMTRSASTPNITTINTAATTAIGRPIAVLIKFT